MAFLKGRFDAALGIVEKHLAKSKFMVGDSADHRRLLARRLHVLPPEESGYDWPKTNPNLSAWIERMRALPGWKDPYELMPGERIKPLR